MEITRGLSVVNFVLASYSDGAASSPHRFMTEHDVLHLLADAALFDGHVSPNEVHLAVGGFGARKEKKKLPMDVYNKVALYIILAARFDVKIDEVYFTKNAAEIYFDRGYAAWVFAAEWPFFTQMLKVGKALGTGADHVLKKHEKN